MLQLEIGDEVRHDVYGRGFVSTVKGDMASIRFDDGVGIKTMRVSNSPLVKVFGGKVIQTGEKVTPPTQSTSCVPGLEYVPLLSVPSSKRNPIYDAVMSSLVALPEGKAIRFPLPEKFPTSFGTTISKLCRAHKLGFGVSVRKCGGFVYVLKRKA
jgi:hypothetical protein